MDESILIVAEALAQSEIDAGVKRAVGQLARQPANFNGLCVDCHAEIPEQRIRFGAVTCIFCQSERERRLSLFR